MKNHKSDAAVVVIDPRKDVLSEKGVTRGCSATSSRKTTPSRTSSDSSKPTSTTSPGRTEIDFPKVPELRPHPDRTSVPINDPLSPQTGISRSMTPIRLQDTVFFTTDFDNCVNELSANHANFQAPLHVTIPPARRVGVPQIRVHELVVEFNETRTTRATVVAVLAKYGCQERVQDSDAFPGGPVAANPPPIFVSVITTQMT